MKTFDTSYSWPKAMRELNSQYSIGYTPADQNLDGSYRRIRVEVRRRGVTLRYKADTSSLLNSSSPAPGPRRSCKLAART